VTVATVGPPVKAFFAILLTLILVAAQSGAATASPTPCPKARCGCCAGGCAGRDCCLERSDGAPQSQPAAPAAPEHQLEPLVLAVTLPGSAPLRVSRFLPTSPAAVSAVVTVPIFRRGCTVRL
jgi:hypothetical protein